MSIVEELSKIGHVELSHAAARCILTERLASTEYMPNWKEVKECNTLLAVLEMIEKSVHLSVTVQQLCYENETAAGVLFLAKHTASPLHVLFDWSAPESEHKTVANFLVSLYPWRSAEGTRDRKLKRAQKEKKNVQQ